MIKAKTLTPRVSEAGAYDALCVDGAVVQSIERGLNFVKSFAHKILADNGLLPLEESGRYTYNAFLLALKHVGEFVGPNTLYLMGRSMPLPAQPTALHTSPALALSLTLGLLNESHRSHIFLQNTPLTISPGDRYPDAVGCIRTLDVGDNSAVILADLPYPEPFLRGYIEAALQLALPNLNMELLAIDAHAPELPPVVSYTLRW